MPDAPTDRSSEPALLDQAVVERVLGAGLARGADFAEVFVEDRRSSSALLDDGRVEELTSGRDRGAGIRVVVGDSTGFAHTSDLSEAGLIAAELLAQGDARRL
ncbi:MAG TPA: DNA gyrase modulator, partial [Microthrixaceae bacterium]|nr:DNA gyrase modulator [Microthrixaceae bacterium]